MSYVYIETQGWETRDEEHKKLFRVGFYNPSGGFETESDHSDPNRAASRVHYLNGGVWDRGGVRLDET